jgi:hypothetical protein
VSGKIRRKDFLAKEYFLAVWKEGPGEAAGQVGVDLYFERPEVVVKMAFVVLMEQVADW